MLDLRGFVAETNATHVFIVHDEKILTPHTHACPEGITRHTVLELCEADGIVTDVRNISTTEIYRADEMFCTGTMGELAAVTVVDGRTIGTGEPGPMTKRLSARFQDAVMKDGNPIV
jgi:branched-chain amino acid aminotransferase